MISHCLCVFEIEYIRGRPIVFRHLVEQLLSKRTCLVFSWFIRLIFHAAACKLEGHESPTTDNLKTLLVWGLCPSAKMNLAERTRTVYASDAFSRRPLSCTPAPRSLGCQPHCSLHDGRGHAFECIKGLNCTCRLAVAFLTSTAYVPKYDGECVARLISEKKAFVIWNG